MEIKKFETQIHQYIINDLNYGVEFEINANIIQQEIIDSMQIMKLVSFLENTFNIEIELETINAENFATVGSIAKFVKNIINRKDVG
jgi:acyl carrier protein